MNFYFRTLSLLFFTSSFFINSAQAQPISIGFFPDHIYLSRTESTGLYQEVLFFKQVGQTLVEAGSADELLPGIAESWTVSKDRKKYTFKLRPNLKFSDGTPLTPTDIVEGLNRTIYNPQNSLKYYLKSLKNLEKGWKNKKCAGITVKSTNEVEFTLEKPYSPLLKVLTSGLTAIFKTPVTNEPIVGSGPYKIVKNDQGYSLAANQFYSGVYPPSISEIKLIVNSEYLYGKKEVPASELPDYDAFVPVGLIKLYDPKKFTITRSPNLGTIGFYPNLRSKNCKTRAQRLAVLSLLYQASHNMAALTAETIPGSPLTDIYPRGMIAHQADRKSWQDLEMTLKKSNFQHLPNQLTLAATGQMLGNTQRLISEIAKLSKIKVNILVINPPHLLEEIESKEYDVLHQIWHSVVSDPYSQLVLLEKMHSFDAKKMKMLENSVSYEQDSERSAAYSKIADKIFEDALFLPIYQRDHISALRNGFKTSSFFYRYQPMFSEIQRK